MKVYNYSKARQSFSKVLNNALTEEVIITRKDGSKFKLTSIPDTAKKGKSPLDDIKGIKTSISMCDILEAIRERRE